MAHSLHCSCHLRFALFVTAACAQDPSQQARKGRRYPDKCLERCKLLNWQIEMLQEKNALNGGLNAFDQQRLANWIRKAREFASRIASCQAWP